MTDLDKICIRDLLIKQQKKLISQLKFKIVELESENEEFKHLMLQIKNSPGKSSAKDKLKLHVLGKQIAKLRKDNENLILKLIKTP